MKTYLYLYIAAASGPLLCDIFYVMCFVLILESRQKAVCLLRHRHSIRFCNSYMYIQCVTGKPPRQCLDPFDRVNGWRMSFEYFHIPSIRFIDFFLPRWGWCGGGKDFFSVYFKIFKLVFASRPLVYMYIHLQRALNFFIISRAKY